MIDGIMRKLGYINEKKLIASANVAPVVRCKDCARYLDLRHWCKCHDTTMFENDFCSYGERKE